MTDTLSVWQLVEMARHQDRPYFGDYVSRLVPDFVELHGDRLSADDPALVAGIGTWHGRTAVFMGNQKGRTLSERLHRNWGMMHPEGYRKAIRLAHQAAKFGFPIVCLVDTPGAYPGAGAEERGIAAAIAGAIMEWFTIPVPVVACIIGEGGSGGALGLAVADRVLMMENSIYSVASPEAAASIVWRDNARSTTPASRRSRSAARSRNSRMPPSARSCSTSCANSTGTSPRPRAPWRCRDQTCTRKSSGIR